MESTDPLAQLKDIHLPDPVGFWPLAWGWWLLIIVLIVAAAVGIYLWRLHKTRNRYRSEALQELSTIKNEFDQHANTATYLQQVSIILRRAALSGFAQIYNPNIHGEAWSSWLDNQCPATKNNFTQGAGRALLSGPYEPNPQADVPALHQLVKLWLKEHKNQWQKKSAAVVKTKKMEANNHA